MRVSPLTDHFTWQLIHPKTSTFLHTRVTLRPTARQIPITKCECSFNATTWVHDPSSAQRTMISTLISLHCQNSTTSQTTVAQHIESTGDCIVCTLPFPDGRMTGRGYITRRHSYQTLIATRCWTCYRENLQLCAEQNTPFSNADGRWSSVVQ